MLCFALSALTIASVSASQTSDEEDRTPRVRDLRFDPDRPETGQKLVVRMNLQNAVRAEVKWVMNGEEVGLTDFTGIPDHLVFPMAIRVGDNIKATVTPFDEFGQAGDPVEKEAVCLNAPPSLSLVSENVDGEMYKARVKAVDPEGGPVTLTLLEGPQGMAMDEQGNITWKLAKGVSGSFPVKVSAKDEQGAEEILSYSIRIRQQPGRPGQR